jgi:hypothetical protein
VSIGAPLGDDDSLSWISPSVSDLGQDPVSVIAVSYLASGGVTALYRLIVRQIRGAWGFPPLK